MLRTSQRNCILAGLLLTGSVLAGCAPKSMIEGVPWVTERYGVTDASAQRVEYWSCLRFDTLAVHELAHAADGENLQVGQADVRRVLEGAHESEIRIMRNELDRLSDEGWTEIHQRYFEGAQPPNAKQRDIMWQAYLQQTESRYQALIAEVEATSSLAGLREITGTIAAKTEESIKTRGRLARALPWALFSGASAIAVAKINDDEYLGPLDRDFDASCVYTVVEGTPDANWDERTRRLLLSHAPIIVQELSDGTEYVKSIDHPGRVIAMADEDIRVDPTQAVVYAYSREFGIDGERFTQLVYTTWYSEHPETDEGSNVEAGHLDGSVLRLTLDENEHPVLFETLLACGCYHRTYPTSCLETRAKATWGNPDGSKRFAIERDIPGDYDLIVPKIVDESAGTSRRSVVRAAAGYHALIDISFDREAHAAEEVASASYELRPYEDLVRLPLPDGRITSMFYDNGLVKGAQRPEGVFFTPIGILSSGQPRQRGTHLIRWDHWDFDDPTLFLRGLRWPDQHAASAHPTGSNAAPTQLGAMP